MALPYLLILQAIPRSHLHNLHPLWQLSPSREHTQLQRKQKRHNTFNDCNGILKEYIRNTGMLYVIKCSYLPTVAMSICRFGVEYRPLACVGVVRILYLKVYDFSHTCRHFVGQWNSSNVHVDPLLAPYQQY